MRFYVSSESIFPEKNLIEIRDRDEIHHIRDVMRIKKGAAVTVFDGNGKEYSGDIGDIDKNRVLINIKESRDVSIDKSLSITFYQAIPKKGKMDFIIEKAVELGVSVVTPIITERTIPIIKDRVDKKIDRWRRLAKAASKQCGRMKLPTVSNVMRFDSALIESKKSDLMLFAALDKDARPLAEILKAVTPKTVSVFIGPEGDFSPKEIAMAKRDGCKICSLGPLVLKVETAAIYVLSSLNYEYPH